ncbi:MAG TPA: hypothetical protein VLE49_14940 [Anaerolineales bacterium]|nr:hypothetical protein [Anaerolineales bacterium]
MSENADARLNLKKTYLKILLVFLSILILLFVYGAGYIVLPLSIYGSFQYKNCGSVLTLHKVYTGLYPELIEDKTLLDQVRECETYVSAAANEQEGSWRAAYDAYQVYGSTYPNGLYAKEVHEHSAIVLLNIVKEQVEQRKYEEAITNLNLIPSDYSDTSVSAQVWTLASATYIPWGRDLREAGDFEGSERVLNDFKSWSQNYQKPDLATEAQRELVQTYLAWGLDLQSQKQFESGLAKLELAVAADPQAQFDSATKVKASRSGLFVEWGNDLLERREFPAAIQKFEQAVARAEGGTSENARDALANGHIQWASHLRGTEDFTGALEHLRSAKQASASDTMNTSVDTALQATHLAFSKSTGQQARRAIREALKTVCEKHEVPDLPIFGLNKDSIRFGIYGVEDKLPENLAAPTPGEMHYVACITVDDRTIQSREHRNIVLKVRGGYYYTVVQQFRVQIIWDVRLLQVDTNKSVAERTFTGAPPPPFPEQGGNYFYGPTPMEEFTVWLQSVVP